MKTWRYLLQLLRYRPWLYGLNMLAITAHLLVDMVPGLLMREYFNILTRAAPARINLETLIVCLTPPVAKASADERTVPPRIRDCPRALAGRSSCRRL